VINYDAPSSKAAIGAFEDVHTRSALLKFARWFTNTDLDAEALLNDAVDAVCDPDEGRPWDPTRGSILTHMRIVMRDLARRERRSARARREVLDPGYAFDESMASSNPGPEQALSDARELEEYRRLGTLLRGALERKGRTRAVQVLDAMAREELDRPEDLARHLVCDVTEVYEAKRLIAREGAQVRAKEEKAAAERMKLRRIEATNTKKENS
jgi:hypothetical protein